MEKKYAVLTSQGGTIHAVISFKNKAELVRKTREQINHNVFEEEIEEIPAENIGLECTIPVYEKGATDVPVDEFFLTPVNIV